MALADFPSGNIHMISYSSFKKTKSTTNEQTKTVLIFNYLKAPKINFQVDTKLIYGKLTLQKNLEKNATPHLGA